MIKLHTAVTLSRSTHSTVQGMSWQCAVHGWMTRGRTHGRKAVLGLLVFSDLGVDAAVPGHGVGAHSLHTARQADVVIACLDGSRHAGNSLQA